MIVFYNYFQDKSGRVILMNKQDPCLAQFGVWLCLELVKKNTSHILKNKIMEHLALASDKQMV
jgi:hypothetical protein